MKLADATGPDFEATARRHCDDLLGKIREAFGPQEGLEAMVLMAFTKGAAWALDIDMEAARAPKS